MTCLQEQQHLVCVQRGASRMSWEEMSRWRETKWQGVAVLVMDTLQKERKKTRNEITRTLNKIRHLCSAAPLWEKINFYY